MQLPGFALVEVILVGAQKMGMGRLLLVIGTEALSGLEMKTVTCLTGARFATRKLGSFPGEIGGANPPNPSK